MPALAARMNEVSISASVVMTMKGRELAAQGIKVISLASGEPDFPTPLHAIEAAHKAALAGDTKYPPQDGTKQLKEAIQRKFRRDNRLDYALDEIMVANGGKQCIYNALMATVDPGDEVVIPAPYWISYADMAKVAGGKPVLVSCPQNNGFKLRPEDLDAAITPRTKWVMLNFPNNPTGAACSREEMKAIAAVLKKHPHVWVMTDDMYEHLVYDGFEFCTIAEVEPALKDRTLTVNGASKTYAMTGWRVGFCGGPKALIKAMINMQGQATSGISTVGQAAAAAALDGPQDLVRERAEDYRRRRDMVVEMLNAAPGIACHKPEGAFYVFPNIAGCLGKTTKAGRKIETDTDFALALLEEKHVAAVQGAAYGMSPYLRISYATDTDSLREACGRIQEFCRELDVTECDESGAPVTLRAGRDEDAAGFIALIGACWAEYPGCVLDVDGEVPELRALATYFRSQGGMLWVAQRDARLIGMVGTRPLTDDAAWEICRMYVDADARGAGLAAGLLRTAESHARAAGARRLVLWTDTRFNRAHGFYEKHGYVRQGSIRILDDISNSLEFRYAKPARGLVVEALDAAAAASAERPLAELLAACVAGGASLEFLPPLPRERAVAFWKQNSAAVAAGSRVLLVAWRDGVMAGSVTLDLATAENQPHVAAVQKLMVDPAARRAGIGRALMRRAEQAARGHGRRVLALDTRAGSAAEALYRAEGWQDLGRIPGFEVDGARRPCDTVFFWKAL